jgi:voltage-gated sodium channel type II alpha
LRSGNTILCGNSSLASQCANGTVCLTVGDNPNSGYTSFDSYMFAMLSAFRLMTQDYWENLYTLILTTEGPVHFFFFLFVIFFGSFYLINLILAIVALSYGEQQEKAIAEAIEIEKKRLQEVKKNLKTNIYFI